jgi:hypothetical protein
MVKCVGGQQLQRLQTVCNKYVEVGGAEEGTELLIQTECTMPDKCKWENTIKSPHTQSETTGQNNNTEP